MPWAHDSAADSWISDIGERRMAVSANCKKPRGRKGGKRGREYETQEDAGRLKAPELLVSVVSGTITGTYPLRYPRPFLLLLFILLS